MVTSQELNCSRSLAMLNMLTECRFVLSKNLRSLRINLEANTENEAIIKKKRKSPQKEAVKQVLLLQTVQNTFLPPPKKDMSSQ